MKSIVLLCSLFFIVTVSVNAQESNKLAYPEIGILSNDYEPNWQAYTEISYLKGAQSVRNKELGVCKTYIKSIEFKALKKLLVFDNDDLNLMEKDDNRFGKDSEYFKTCNYLDKASYIQNTINLFKGDFDWDESVFLEWDRSDAYIDGNYALLLIQFPEDFYLNSSDTQEVSVLYI